MPADRPRIGFIGAGSIGSIVGGLMAEAGHDVTLVDQWPEHVDAIKRSGLRLSGSVGERTVKVPALHLHELQSVGEPFDIVFVCVKSYDTEWSAQLMLPYAGPGAVFVSLQNCLNDERLAGVVGRERTLGTVTTISTGLYEPGHAQRTDSLTSGKHVTGSLDGRDTPELRQVVEILGDAGTSQQTDDLMRERWAKFVGNCGANAVVGISGYGTVEMIRTPMTRRVMIHATAEAVRVARALGQQPGPAYSVDPDLYVDASEGRRVEEAESALLAYADKSQNTGVASFGQDVLKGRRTEIDYLNGYISQKGRETGVPTPVSDAITGIIHSQPTGKFQPDPALLEPVQRLTEG
ncbi:MAG: ketopantoate reductase family protein [Chloroflexota bacterium]